MEIKTYNLTVFPSPGENGGNPTATYIGESLTSTQMQSLAQKSGHECGFVFPPEDPTCDYTMRYWVPNHEMEMCGHATVGAVWLLHELQLIEGKTELRISTLSGVVEARIVPTCNGSISETPTILVSQPAGTSTGIPPHFESGILSCLGLEGSHLAPDLKIRNAQTSRTKTLIPIKDRDTLGSLAPTSASVQSICEKIDSTGLYPYTILDAEAQLIEARQFPRSSGYAEDPATGIAAAALVFGLLEEGVLSPDSEKPVVVRQGTFMGKPSEIRVSLRRVGGEIVGCWISGEVRWVEGGEGL